MYSRATVILSQAGSFWVVCEYHNQKVPWFGGYVCPYLVLFYMERVSWSDTMLCVIYDRTTLKNPQRVTCLVVIMENQKYLNAC